MAKKDEQEPQGFQPIEYTPYQPTGDVEDTFVPIEVPVPQAAPVADTEKPATGTKEK